MASSWKTTLLGALGGAAIAVGIVYGAAVTGHFPQDVARNDQHIHDYLMAHPQLFADMAAKYQTQQDAEADEEDVARQAAIDKLGEKSFFNPKVAFVTGPQTARTTLVEFFDYNCLHCRNSVRAVQRFYDAHKDDTRFAFIEFPIFGDQSTFAARAALAARRQAPDKYVAFHFAMMTEPAAIDEDTVYEDAARVGLNVAKLKTDMNDPAIAGEIAASHTLAHVAKVDGTPEFIIDGKSREGEVDDATLKQMTGGGVSKS
jgi:protein-disulfide isomerase